MVEQSNGDESRGGESRSGAARDFEGKVESRLHHKDIRIVLDVARAFGIELPASAAAADVLERLQQRGGARQDSAAIFNVLDTARNPTPRT